MIDFERISYLQQGDATQQHAFHVLEHYGVLAQLHAFSPLLAGTIPLQIYIEGSDLDIICCWQDKEAFKATLQSAFHQHRDFKLVELPVSGIDTVLASFSIEDFEIEVFGQNRPSHEQPAYQHMLKEYTLLQLHGESFKEKVMELKRKGYKTEPAFAMLLKLEGDPYEALLKLEV